MHITPHGMPKLSIPHQWLDKIPDFHVVTTNTILTRSALLASRRRPNSHAYLRSDTTVSPCESPEAEPRISGLFSILRLSERPQVCRLTRLVRKRLCPLGKSSSPLDRDVPGNIHFGSSRGDYSSMTKVCVTTNTILTKIYEWV